MSKSTVKLQIPLDKSLRDQVAKHAREQGFSSIQDFTRVMYSTVIHENLRMSLRGDEERLSPEASKRLDKQTRQAITDHQAGKLPGFDNAEDALEYLHNL